MTPTSLRRGRAAAWLAVAALLAGVRESGAQTGSFRLLETTVDEVHAAYKGRHADRAKAGPALVVPAGFTSDNLPSSLTFLGRPYDDGRMIGLAYAYEQATRHRRPPSTTP